MTDFPTEPYGATGTRQPQHRLRLLVVMAQGSPGELPEAWRSYARLGDARVHALEALRNPQVRHVAIVEDNNPLQLVEWVREPASLLCRQLLRQTRLDNRRQRVRR